jgi:hypothetical protein
LSGLVRIGDDFLEPGGHHEVAQLLPEGQPGVDLLLGQLAAEHCRGDGSVTHDAGDFFGQIGRRIDVHTPVGNSNRGLRRSHWRTLETKRGECVDDLFLTQLQAQQLPDRRGAQPYGLGLSLPG